MLLMYSKSTVAFEPVLRSRCSSVAATNIFTLTASFIDDALPFQVWLVFAFDSSAIDDRVSGKSMEEEEAEEEEEEEVMEEQRGGGGGEGGEGVGKGGEKGRREGRRGARRGEEGG